MTEGNTKSHAQVAAKHTKVIGYGPSQEEAGTANLTEQQSIQAYETKQQNLEQVHSQIPQIGFKPNSEVANQVDELNYKKDSASASKEEQLYQAEMTRTHLQEGVRQIV